VPHYGIFSRFYFGRMLKSTQGQDEKYSSFKKNFGPPFYHFNPRVAPVDHDPFLARRGIPAASMRIFEPRDRMAHALPTGDTKALH
jgi:hypothetical protein